jgi:DNA-directed RNA polymerase specialized sigma24 family protein
MKQAQEKYDAVMVAASTLPPDQAIALLLRNV